MSTSGDILRFGKGSVTSVCTILVISCNDELLPKASNDLNEVNETEFEKKFQFNFSSSISSYLRFTSKCFVDYIVILVNPCKYNWHTEVEDNIALMDKVFLCGRLCLVVDTSNITDRSADMSQVRILKKKYSIPVIYGESNRKEIWRHAMSGILNLVSGVCCNPIGIPLITEFFQ